MPSRTNAAISAFLFAAWIMSMQQVAAQCPNLVWSDEFDGQAVNEANWSFQTGGSGWGNNELQYYRPENATVEDGVLKITAREENYRGKNYTSTRMRSMGKADFTHGRFEARIKMTIGQGIWPAFWMMPTDSVYGGWPKSGEIDIMENIGHEPSQVHGTLHYGDPTHQFSGNSFKLYGGQRFTDDFHIFAIEKDPNEIRWYVDGVLFNTLTPDEIQPEFWPFEERFHFILNLAVGGNWPGNPDETTLFPQVLEVDYVRVYDGNFPSISGRRDIPNQAKGEVYTISNAPSGTSFTWSVPNGASIISGQGTNAITVDWADTSGQVVANLDNACGSSQMAINVYVNPALHYDFSFENFDEPAASSVVSSTGSLSEIPNPDSSGLNPSAIAGQYIRNAAQLYDTLFYETSAAPDGSEYVERTRRLFMDVHTTAPVGSQILIQLEDSSLATAENFPTGRHSRYQGTTHISNAWERIELNYLDQPDSGTGDGSIDNMVVLFAPNTQTGDTWIFDNLDSYTTQAPAAPPSAPSGLTATSASATSINLSWTDNANNETGFKIERSPDGIAFSQIAVTGQSSVGFNDISLQGDTTYYYRVKAYNSGGDSAYSDVAFATTDSVGQASTMFISALTAGSQTAGKGQKYGTATVSLLDNTGAPVQGAIISGSFSGSYNEMTTGVTNADGSTLIQTAETASGNVQVTFCVANITHPSLAYDPGSNVLSCDSL